MIFKSTIKTAFIILSVAASVLGLYAFFVPASPQIVVQVFSDVPVVSFREEVKDLNVWYKGKDLKNGNLELRALTVKILNSGNVTFLNSHFQIGEYWGVKFPGSKIVSFSKVESNSEKLGNAKMFVDLDRESIQLEPVIFEKGKHIVLKLLMLSPKGSEAEVLFFGQIADVDKVQVERPYAITAADQSGVFSGTYKIRVLRLLAYPALLGVLVFAGVIALLPVVLAIDAFRKRYRKSKVAQLRGDGKANFKNFSLASELYEIGGVEYLNIGILYLKGELPNLIDPKMIAELGQGRPRRIGHHIHPAVTYLLAMGFDGTSTAREKSYAIGALIKFRHLVEKRK